VFYRYTDTDALIVAIDVDDLTMAGNTKHVMTTFKEELSGHYKIKDLSERVRETNLLTGGLQKLLTPLLGRSVASRTDERTPAYTVDEPETDHQTGGG